MSEEIEKNKVALPEPGSLVLSTSPHVQDGDSISKIMAKVLICLLPAIAASIWFFRTDAVRILVYCSSFCIFAEYGWTLLTRQAPTVGDFSALVTGVILALNLPPGVPWWLCLVGSVFAIVIVKELFGGLGQNPFNPAAAARVALLVGFAGPMTHWGAPATGSLICQVGDVTLTTGATPLAAAHAARSAGDAANAMAQLGGPETLKQLFLGNVGGSIGETSALAILIGGLGLLAFRLIKWQIPLGMLATIFIFTGIVNAKAPGLTPAPLYHILSGGVMIGAFFMATDMVTSPMTGLGALVFGVVIGLLTCVIRIWGAYPEGVSFSILIANALVPLIDRFCYKRPFGWHSHSASALQIRRGEIK